MLARKELLQSTVLRVSNMSRRGWNGPSPSLPMFTLVPARQKAMLIGDFQNRLKRVNPLLYVQTEMSVKREEGHRHSGIYLKNPKRQQMNVSTEDYGSVNPNHIKYLEALEKGELDSFICGICIDFIPEYDIFNLEYSRLCVPGWRSIALTLVNKKVATLDKVRKAFNCKGLGESDYDKMSFFQKLEFAKRFEDGN